MGQANDKGTYAERKKQAVIIKMALLFEKLRQNSQRMPYPIWLFACEIGSENWLEKRMKAIMSGEKPRAGDACIYRSLTRSLRSN